MKELDRTGSGRQAGRSKDESGGDNKSDSWIEGKDGSYRGSRRRDSRWDESDNAKRIWHNNNEDRMALGQRFRGGPEWGDMGSDMPEDGRDGDRREDYHIRKVKDVVESNVEDVESWDRSGNRRQDDEEKTNDRHISIKDRDDIVEGRGRPVAKNQDEDEDYGDKSRSKDEIHWEEEERKRGWKSSKMGRGVKRSWSPLHRRGRVDQDDPDREWSDDRRDERGFRRDYDRDRDRFPDREADFQQWDRDRDYRTRETFREEGDFFRDRTREKEDPERWKHRQRDRQREKEDDTDYNFERDGWEVPRRDKERAERDFKSGEDRKDKDQIDLLKSPQSSGIVSDTMERGGNSNASIDLVRERGFGSGSPYVSRRGDSGPPGEIFGNNGDADWMGDERHRHLEGDYLDRNFFDEDNSLGPDQNFGRSSSRGSDALTPLNAHSGRGRGPKGSPGQRGRGGGDGRPPFANNQGTGMMMRGLQQSGKGGRGRGGKGGRSSTRDTQRGGGIPPPLMGPGQGPVPVPGPGMVPHFGGHMGPPGSIPVLGSNMGPGPAPGLGPGGFPLPPFVGPVGWAGGRGAADMGMHPGPAGPAPPVHAPSPATPRFGPNMGPGPGPGVFFSPPRGASNVMPAPSYGGAPFGGRGLLPEKAPMSRMPPRVNAPAGLAPSRGEQNDYSQHFVDTGLRPQNFIRDVDLGDRFEEYPKLKELITRKDKLITDHACPPMYLQGDLRALELSPELFGTKFDVILVDPPWEEYVRRAPGVGDSMEWWSFEEIQNLRIEAIADTPSFIFLWVGDAEGLDQGRLCLKKWGFRRCEDICWVKTNKENPTPALRHDASTVLQHSKEHCLMGIRGTVRRSSDAHIIHANIDTDIIISEEPAYGSTAKPEELYHIVEHFALGQRRLELFGEDHNIRNGWITVGKNLTSSNFNAQTYCKYVGDAEGKVWQGGRGNPPLDAPHLVGTTPEIEALRPKSPPPRAQQQPQSQAANSASQPSAAHSNSKKAANASQGMSPQNAQGSGQVANSSSVIVLAASSPSQGQRGGSSKQMRRSPLHLEAGQGITGLEDDRLMGLDTTRDPGATAIEESRQLKDMAS